MSDWHAWATGGSYQGAVVAVLGCAVSLFPLFVFKSPVRPQKLASHASAAHGYARHFRGAPTSVLVAMSRDNLQAASHCGKELSLSKLTYDGLMYTSALSFKESAIATVSGKSKTSGSEQAVGDEEWKSVPQAFMTTERAQVIHAVIVERMAQTNDDSVLRSMQRRYAIRVRSPAASPPPSACLELRHHTYDVSQILTK